MAEAVLIAYGLGLDKASDDPTPTIPLRYEVRISQPHGDEWSQLLDTLITAADRIGYLNDSVDRVEIVLEQGGEA